MSRIRSSIPRPIKPQGGRTPSGKEGCTGAPTPSSVRRSWVATASQSGRYAWKNREMLDDRSRIWDVKATRRHHAATGHTRAAHASDLGLSAPLSGFRGTCSPDHPLP